VSQEAFETYTLLYLVQFATRSKWFTRCRKLVGV
jgi:hypothetical protein